MNVSTMKWNVFSTKYQVALSLLIDVSCYRGALIKALENPSWRSWPEVEGAPEADARMLLPRLKMMT